MTLIKRFEDIEGWQEARKLNKLVYAISASEGLNKDFGLTNQLRRASVSIMANIAEGYDCDSALEFARFLEIAHRSAVEIQSLLYVALDVGYINQTDFNEICQQIRLVKSLVGGLRNAQKKRHLRTKLENKKGQPD